MKKVNKFVIINTILILIIIAILVSGIISGYAVLNENNQKFIPNNSINGNNYDNIYKSVEISENNNAKGAYLSISSPMVFCDKKSLQEHDFTQLVSVPSVTVGDTVVYQLTYSGNIHFLNLLSGHIGLVGFSGTKNFYQSEENPCIVYLVISEIYASHDVNSISVTVNGGTAISSTGEMANGVESIKTKIYQPNLIRLANWLFPDGNAFLSIILAVLGLIFSIKQSSEKRI